MIVWNTLAGATPRIIAHRGASGHRPEHTLEGYALAAAQGADAIEPDVVVSRDGVPHARHDLGLLHSTDIEARTEFASRARTIDGRRDWWICDFDALEIEALRAIQPFPGRSPKFDGQFVVPRLGQVLDLARDSGRERGVPLVVDIEVKSPAFFRHCGIDVLGALSGVLEARALTGSAAPVWLECFDHAFLRAAFEHCGNACFALIDTLPAEISARDDMLRELAHWAKGIAPAKHLLYDRAGKDSGLVAAAHAHGLEVHAWTFRDDLVAAPFAGARNELIAAFELGVDALFCDFPDTALAVRSSRGATGAWELETAESRNREESPSREVVDS